MIDAGSTVAPVDRPAGRVRLPAPAPIAPQHFELGPEDPAIFIGPQRAGKSNLMAWHLEPVRSAVIFDSSHKPDEWAGWGPRHGYIVTSDPDDILRHRLVVFQVPMPALLDVQGWRRPGSTGYTWTQALLNVMKRGNTVCVFDEIVHQLPSGRPNPAAMQLYTQGAKFGIPPWAGTQFVNRVETATVRAAVHCFAWKMNPYDLRLLAEKRGAPTEQLAHLPKYGFGYHLTNTEEYVICQPVERVM